MTDTTIPTEEAPYGYKPDGTPRKRPAQSPEAQARSAATRRAKSRRQSNGGNLSAATSMDWRAAATELERLADGYERKAADLREAARLLQQV